MSIGMHRFLDILLSSGPAILGMVAFLLLLDRMALGMGIMVGGFFAGGVAAHLFSKFVPARCPECAGPAYEFISSERRLCFQCRECGHIHQTGFSERTDDND